jgi:hypothetical protein
MPVKRRAPKLRLSASFRAETIAFLGDDYDDADYPNGMCRFWHLYSLESGHVHRAWGYSIADAWQALGEEIIEVWISEHGGSRPRAWWVYSAPRFAATTWPEPRRRVGLPGQAVPQCVEDDARHLAVTGLMPLGATYESQWTYLLRHNLLERVEQSLALLQPERIAAPVIEFDENGRLLG